MEAFLYDANIGTLIPFLQNKYSGIKGPPDPSPNMTIISRFLFGPFHSSIEALRPLLYRIDYSWCHDAALADDLVQETLSKAWTRRGMARYMPQLEAFSTTATSTSAR